MKAREFNSVLIKLRTDTRKHGNDGIIISWINASNLELSNVRWERTITCSFEGFTQMVGVGYFRIENDDEFDLFLERKIKNFELKINEEVLHKKFIGKGLNFHLQKVFLITGILALLVAAILFMTDSASSGFVYYSRTGNSPMSTDNAINWLHAFIIGSALIFVFIVSKVIDFFRS